MINKLKKFHSKKKLQTLTDVCKNIIFLQPEGGQSGMHQHPSDHRRQQMSLHQSIEGHIDDIQPAPHDQDGAAENLGRMGRRRSLMSQASVKRLFKWKTR